MARLVLRVLGLPTRPKRKNALNIDPAEASSKHIGAETTQAFNIER